MNAINKRGYQDVPMTRRRAQLLAEYANKLAEMLENAPDNQDLAEWVQSKIDRAADQIQSAYHYLDQEDDDLEKAVGHKYTHRKRVGTDKRGRARYRYYYAEHQGGGITSAAFEAGSAFKLTWRGRRGHFHIDRVEGDQVFITHDSRPNMTPVAISKSELRALLKSQHGKAEQEHVEKRRKEVEKIKGKGVKRGLGLALHRLRQAAAQAGVQLDERYQQPKKKKTTETAREDRFETMPEVESAPRSKTPAPKTRADLAKLIHQELLSAGFKDANLWIRNEGTDREKARIYLSGKGRKQGMIEALSPQEYGSEGAFRLKVIQEEGLDGASDKEIQAAIDRRSSALTLKLRPPKLDPKQLQRYLEAISAVARKLKDSAPEILDPSDRPTLALTLDYTETPLAQRSREDLETLRTKAQQLNSRESRPQDRNENTHAVSVAQHIMREVNIALGETKARTTQPPTTPREQLAETAREVIQGADNFETMPEVEAPAREQLAETVRNITAPSSPLNIDQANAQDTLTEDRTRSAESKAADKALIESARELAKTSERGEEIKSALVDLMNAQQLKRYKRATGNMSARAEDMIEKRREARERLRSATSGEVTNNFETMLETEAQPKKQRGPDISRYKRALSRAKKGKLYILDKLVDGKRSQESKEADQALIELAQEILEKDLGDVEIRTIYSKPSTMWTKDERLKVTIGAMAGELKTRQQNLLGKDGAEQSRDLRADARDNLIDAIQEHVDRFPTDEVIDARLDRDIARETAKQEARETQETRPYQPKTFTREIQSAIDTLKFDVGFSAQKSYAIENFFKVRKDGGVYKTTKTPRQLADRIVENLPDNLVNVYDFGEDTLRELITRAINEGVEARETPAELKDRIGSVITKRFRDSAASQKAQITGEGQRKALIEMQRNIKTLSGNGHFNEYRRVGERSYMGLGAIEKTLDMSERLSDLYVDGIFAQALPPELERFKLPVTRFSAKAADEVAGAFANKYETVGEIRDNISTIKEQMRSTIKRALDQTTDALVKRPTTLDLINQSYEKATERLNTDRQKNIENARALAQYTDNPQAHLAEIQELERQSDQAIAEQMEINREFASAYIHEASDLAERALETTKGEVIDNVMKVKTPLHANKFTATERGTANRKLMARIFNQVFEQVRREIGDEPIERGEKHPRNIADTVKKPSKTPAQFRGDIERADEEKRERKLAEREAKRARQVTKSANHMIDYRAQLLQTIERIA